MRISTKGASVVVFIISFHCTGNQGSRMFINQLFSAVICHEDFSIWSRYRTTLPLCKSLFIDIVCIVFLNSFLLYSMLSLSQHSGSLVHFDVPISFRSFFVFALSVGPWSFLLWQLVHNLLLVNFMVWTEIWRWKTSIQQLLNFKFVFSPSNNMFFGKTQFVNQFLSLLLFAFTSSPDELILLISGVLQILLLIDSRLP